MVNLALIGTGAFARWHAEAYTAMRNVRITACCDTDEGKAREFAATHGIPAVYTDYNALLSDGVADAVSVATPDQVHAEVAVAAARQGLHVFCEKPLATSVRDARHMLQTARKAGIVHMVNFTYRNAPALQKAAQLIARGGIGQIRHVAASYLQSWLTSRVWGDWRTTPHLTWRLSRAHGSLGVLGDVGCHILDSAAFLAGEIAEVHCVLKSFHKGEPRNRVGPYRLDANDSFIASATFRNGAIGTIQASRWATGHVNSVRLCVYGDRGAVEVDLDRDERSYRLCAGRKDIDAARWRTVPCAATPANYQRFIRAITRGAAASSDFENGYRVQRYLDACFRSAETDQPVPVRR